MNAPAPLARVTVVTVCHNSLAVLPAMLQSLPAGVACVIVDNASRDATALAELAESHRAALIRNAENRGFGAACNQGAAVAETEFILFLNPDAAMLPGALERLVEAADHYGLASAMNPRIENVDGSAYFKRRSPLLPRRDWMPRGWPATDREVTVLSGAALLVRATAFARVGGFDERIFLYHEDDDLSLRLRAEAGPVMFILDAGVRHIGGSSSARTPETAAFKAWHMGQSRVYSMQKHGISWARTTSLLGAVLRLASPDTILSARRRAKNLAYLKGLLHRL